MGEIIANVIAVGWEPLEPSPQLSLAQFVQSDSQVPLLEPRRVTSSKSEGQPEGFSNIEVDHQVTDLTGEEGTVIDDNGPDISIIHDKADRPDVGTVDESKDPAPESGNNPDLVQIDVEYPSKSIFYGGESVYFSTSHHEVIDPAMFKSARATLDRLQPDLEPIMGRLGRKFVRASSSSHMSLVTVELRMAGEIEQGSTKITLQPSVWILCGEKSTCKAIQRRLEQLAWLTSAHYSPVYVRNALRLASSELFSGLAGLDFSHGTPFWADTPNGRLQRKVHVHVQRSDMLLSHGELCCITITQGDDAEVLHRKICRIGGYIIVDLPTGPQLAALTTGHGLLEYWIQQNLGHETSSSVTEETEAMVMEDPDSEHEIHIKEFDTKRTDCFINTEVDRVAEWEPAALFPGNINFISQASPTIEGSFEVKTNNIDTDFLLLSVDTRKIPGGAPTMAEAMEKVRVSSHIPDATMSLAKISGMIMDTKSGAPKAAEILPDVIPFFVDGVMFQTKKVELSEPTRKWLKLLATQVFLAQLIKIY
jgi:hypothetical protein